jgi:hypothetical protein
MLLLLVDIPISLSFIAVVGDALARGLMCFLLFLVSYTFLTALGEGTEGRKERGTGRRRRRGRGKVRETKQRHIESGEGERGRDFGGILFDQLGDHAA